MKSMVIDGSVILGFLLPDERGALALKVLAYLEGGGAAFVPQHWWLEVANGLLIAERRKRVSRADASRSLELVGSLPVATDDGTASRAGGETMALARQHKLSVYDAAYLDLAITTGSGLATADRALAQAATDSGVPLFGV
jgi:predicted nucleic acid-binding protein